MKSVIFVAPWQHIQIDLIDFHDFTNINYRFAQLLTCVCMFSKYLIAILIKNKEADTVDAHLVKDIFRIPGLPTILQSDNKKEFEGIVKQVCETFNIKIKHGHPRHLQSQGQVERLNQTISRGFTKLLQDRNNQLQKKNWVDMLDAFVISYNSTMHTAHKRTPQKVMFSQKMHCIYKTLILIQIMK